MPFPVKPKGGSCWGTGAACVAGLQLDHSWPQGLAWGISMATRSCSGGPALPREDCESHVRIASECVFVSFPDDFNPISFYSLLHSTRRVFLLSPSLGSSFPLASRVPRCWCLRRTWVQPQRPQQSPSCWAKGAHSWGRVNFLHGTPWGS